MEKTRRVYERQEQRRYRSTIEEAEAGEKMQGQYRFWQERCEICRIKGWVDYGTSLYP
jgi:hypothetical protein